MKPYSGIAAVRPAGGLRLEVTFKGVGKSQGKGGWTATVDLEPWIADVAMLQRLRDPALFAAVQVHEWGWHVFWLEDELDMAGDQLWRLAGEQAGELMPADAFRAWRRENGLSLTAAAEVLGISRRQLAYYDSGTRPVPRTIRLATIGYEAEREAA
jgi:hypothetical protein